MHLEEQRGKLESSRGFSVPEILTACVVLALLAGVLMPVIARGKMNADRVACMSNQRQIGAALLIYANEHDGNFPETTHTVDVGQSWIYTLASYLDEIDKVRISPAESPARKERLLRQKGTSYILNGEVFVPKWDDEGNLTESSYNNIRRLPFPGRTLLAFNVSETRSPGPTTDHTHTWLNWQAALYDIEPDRHRVGQRAADRMHGSANYLYADGHVENLTAAEFRSRFEGGKNPAKVPLAP